MKKLQSYIDEACIPVKERKFKEYKENEHEKAKRVDRKRKSSEIKSRRGSKRFSDFWLYLLHLIEDENKIRLN